MGGPVLPAASTPLRVEGVALGQARIDLEVTEDGTVLEGLPSGIEVYTEPYRPDSGTRAA